MARNESWLVNTAAYAALRTLGTSLQIFDVNSNMRTFGVIGDIAYRYDRRHRERAQASLSRCFPQFTPAEVSLLARRSMRHLLQLVGVEVLFTPRLITPSTWHHYVRFGHIADALAIAGGREPALFVTGHCGNFELLGFTLAAVGYPLHALARPLDLPKINDWLLDVRQRRGMSILTKFGAMEAVPEIIDAGGNVAFTADQNAGDKGMFVPFFGRLASAYKSIGLLAMRNRIPIICGHAQRLAPDRFEYVINVFDIIRPEEWQERPDPLFYITARYTYAIENMVRAAPEQYFWVHRRWKSRPRHERLGKRFPPQLRDQLLSLPWLTADDVAAIVEASERESKEHAAAAAAADSAAAAESSAAANDMPETPDPAVAEGADPGDANIPSANSADLGNDNLASSVQHRG